ncbi:hypothetical protein CSKR_201046 [Clonorchis sinensis]|uniref:PDZ domain-containing protein n=1 Tax=Clonorchis sinensis TaxID=79923 RepID=A0A8T1MLJ3_CLOSI|nr:hypothetical protein CSKR_201046 [Clonorchis sinensis]
MTYVERRLLLQNGPPWGFRLYEDFMEGLIVSKIRRQSPADHAGLREGDHVLAINGMDALDMSHARAVQIIDYASYSLEIIVGRYERLQKMERIYLDNQALRSKQRPQEITTTELQLFWEKEMPLKPIRKAWPPPQETVIIHPPQQTVRVVQPPPPPPPPPQPVTIHIPAPPPRPPTPENERLIIPNDPDVSRLSVKQLMREFDAPPIPPEARKKTYADSSFYSDPNKYYPTVEEQIEMARRVADSLQDPENYAKGVNMFEKQRIRADKHVREGPDPEPDPIEEATPDELEHMTPPSPPPPPPPPPPSFPGLQPVNKPTVPIPPPPPMLPGQPKTVQEFLEKIKVFPKNRHTDLDPQKCFDIATALYTSDSRGAQMFAKRHARAKKWDAEANENGGSSVAQPAAAAAFGPSLKEEHRVKLPSKLPQKTPISQAKPKPIHVDLSHTDTADKPKTSLVDERAMSQPEPQTAVTEAMPKPFGQYSTASNAPPMFAVSPGLGSIDSESVNTGFDTESTQSGWRPVKFKVAQTAS